MPFRRFTRMNRLVPDRPVLARVRRHIGAMPHGLPTALLFSVSVVALMVGSFIAVDRALPALIPRDADREHRGFGLATIVSPLGSPKALIPAPTATVSPSAVTSRPDPTDAAPSQQPAGGSGTRTVAFRGSTGTPPLATDPGSGDSAPATPEATPSPSPPREDDDDGRRSTQTPGPTPRPTQTPTQTPAPTPRPTERPFERPTPRPTQTPSPTPRPTERPTQTPASSPYPTREPHD
jgi:hypothetical protein